MDQRQANNIAESVLDVMRELAPEDIFDEDVLIRWAEDNGYKKIEE